MADQLDLRPRINTPDYSGLVNSYKAPMSSFNQIPQQFAQLIAKKKQQDQWKSAIQQMVQQNPQMAPYAGVLSQRPELFSEIGPSLIKQQGGGLQSGKQPSSIYMNPQDPTDLSPTPKPGYIEYKTSSGDVLGKLVGGAQAKERNKALQSRADVMARGIDVRQINELAKNTGLTPKQQSALQMNNLRADRAISILQNPNITWQELSLGEMDLAGIMQGGVPQVDEVRNTHFPGWQQNVAQWRTYATGHPTENVPQPIREKVLDMVKGVIQIDNKFIQANSKFRKQMIGPTVRGGISQFTPAINEMTNVLSSQPSGQDSSGWSIQR